MPTNPYNKLRQQLTSEQQAKSAAKVEAMKIGMLVREQREKAGLSQTQLGERIGITQQAVSKVEWGEEIELSTLQKIFTVLGGKIVIQMPDSVIPLPPTPASLAAPLATNQ